MNCRVISRVVTASIVAVAALALTAGTAYGQGFTHEFRLGQRSFVAEGSNLFFSLEPGNWATFRAHGPGIAYEKKIEVLPETRVIRLWTPEGRVLSVKTRVIRETEMVNNLQTTVARVYLSRCSCTNDIFIFGKEMVHGDGASWIAGQNDAEPGLFAPGSFLIGARYLIEYAPGAAIDEAEHIAMGLRASVPYGDFDGCVLVRRTSEIDVHQQQFFTYCPDVGLVKMDRMELVARGYPLD